MANELKWKAPTARTSGISAASVSAGANSLGSEIDNETNLDRWLDLELTFTCALAPAVNKVFECYVLYALDGTNYESGDATPTDPTKSPACTFAARAVTTAQAVSQTGIPLRPFKFKLLLKSELDQDATSVTLDAETANEDLQ